MSVADSLFAYSFAALLLTLTPGLDTALILRTATVEGGKKAFQAALGIDTGCFIWGAAVAFGLGALLAASLRAPLTGIVLVLEMTDNYQLILPMIITCLGATLLAQFLGGKPLYSTILARTLAKQEAEQALKQNT